MATARKTTTRRRNVAMGMTIGSGPGRVFHPFRSSSDYDPALAGEKKKRKPAAKKKAVAKKKAAPRKKATVKKAATKRKTTTKRVAVKKRATAPRKKTPSTVFVGGKFKTVTALKAYAKKHGIAHGEIVRAGDGTKANTYYYLKAAKTKNPRGTYSGLVVAARSKDRSVLSAAATDMPFHSEVTKTQDGYVLKVEPKHKYRAQKIVAEFRGTKMAWQNPKPKKATARKLVRTPSGESLVAKSEYLASIKKVRNMLPVNSRVAIVGVAPGAKKTYLLIVKKKDAAVARAIAQSAAKTMTKKAK